MEKGNEHTSPEKIKQEIKELEEKLREIKAETQAAQQMQEKAYIDLIKKIDRTNDKKNKGRIFAAIYLFLIFICIFFAIAFEVYSSYDLRKRQKEMIVSVEDSHNRINLLSSYVSVLDKNLQIIPTILQKNFGQVNNFADNQIKEFERISTKSMESLEKVKNIDKSSKDIIKDVSNITKSTEQSIEGIETLKDKTNKSIEKIENLKRNAQINTEKVISIINEKHKDKIITYLNKYKSTFSSYKGKNDLSLVYKMVIIDEIGNVPYQVIIDALKKYKFKNYTVPDIATLKEWDKNMVDLCNNAINYFKEKGLKEEIKRKDRYFNSFKAKDDYSNYKKWGYFDKTLNYTDLITFYENTLNSVKNRIEYNKKLKESID